MTERSGRPPGADGGAPELGTLTEEAVRLLGALTGWARDHGASVGEGLTGAAATAAEMIREVDEHLARDTCRYCPVCRTVELVRECSPEVRDHLAEAAGSLAKASAAVLSAGVAHAASDPHGRAAGVEHIDLDDGDVAGGDEEWPEEDT